MPRMIVDREIDGLVYVCEKLPAEQGLDLFLRTSSALSSAQGLFEAIALGWDDAELIRSFFAFAREMDPSVIQPLIMELARLPRRKDGEPTPADLDVQALVELAFFAIGRNFGGFLPVGLGALFSGPEPTPETPSA